MRAWLGLRVPRPVARPGVFCLGHKLVGILNPKREGPETTNNKLTCCPGAVILAHMPAWLDDACAQQSSGTLPVPKMTSIKLSGSPVNHMGSPYGKSLNICGVKGPATNPIENKCSGQ